MKYEIKYCLAPGLPEWQPFNNDITVTGIRVVNKEPVYLKCNTKYVLLTGVVMGHTGVFLGIEKPTYAVTDKFKIGGCESIFRLVNVGNHYVVGLSETFTRWHDAVKVANVYGITEEELKQIFHCATKIKIEKI